MSANDIPEWAVTKAYALMNEESGYTPRWLHAFARYIAAHEEAPVDPVEAAVTDLLPNADMHPLEVVIRTAVKRGIGLAKAGEA